MCFGSTKISVPAPPPAPAPAPPSPIDTSLQQKQIELMEENLGIVRSQRAEDVKGRELLEQMMGRPYAEVQAEQAKGQLELLKGLNERYQKAIKGELPVSPAMERSLKEGELKLNEALRRDLGPGYETGDPGIRSLAEFRERAEALREGARTGAISEAEQFGMQGAPLTARIFRQEQMETPTQLGDLRAALFADRSMQNRSNELGFQGQLNYNNLLTQARTQQAGYNAAWNQNMLNGLFGLGGAAVGGAASAMI